MSQILPLLAYITLKNIFFLKDSYKDTKISSLISTFFGLNYFSFLVIYITNYKILGIIPFIVQFIGPSSSSSISNLFIWLAVFASDLLTTLTLKYAPDITPTMRKNPITMNITYLFTFAMISLLVVLVISIPLYILKSQ